MQSPSPDNQLLSLNELQRIFWRSSRGQSKEIYSHIDKSEDFSPQQRMDVYRTTARSAHVSALLDVYPVCRAILGDNYFKQVAKNYFNQMPSFSPDMNNYGASLPGYLAQLIIERDELREYSYLVDLARLEWVSQTIYFSANESIFDVELFQRNCAKQGEKTILKLQASVSFLSSCYPVFQIWQSHRNGNPQQEINAISERQYLCIYKREYEVLVEPIDAKLYALLLNVDRGLTLAEIAKAHADDDELNAALATAVEQQWLIV